MSTSVPTLHVEGPDDIIVINSLLARHGVDTERGERYLRIKSQGNIVTLLDSMPDAIKAATDRPVGFVVDIDVEISNRWDAVRGRLSGISLATPFPEQCPESGYFGQVSDYPHRFGVWLMPDCKTDFRKIEHLCCTLLPNGDPLWQHALNSVARAIELIDAANSKRTTGQAEWVRFRDVDLVKAEIHTWLAWRQNPGVSMGAAINAHFLNHDSPEALAVLRWLKALYGFQQMTHI